jgi:hypothetical protein
MTDDGYAKQIFQWQRQVLADGELRPLAIKVALALCGFINRGSRDAWPSQGTLAKVVHASRAGVQKALYQLAERGHLHTIVNRGRGRSNNYRPALLVAADVDRQSENANASRQGVPTTGGTRVPTPVGTNYLSGELFEEPSEIYTPPPAHAKEAVADKEYFEEFYRLYPKHVAPRAALRAYKQALARGAAVEELKLGAMRYAAERCDKPEVYTKAPATWLNGDCWKDQPAKPAALSDLLSPENSARPRAGGGNGYAAIARGAK